jgi:hypothetical protein
MVAKINYKMPKLKIKAAMAKNALIRKLGIIYFKAYSFCVDFGSI